MIMLQWHSVPAFSSDDDGKRVTSKVVSVREHFGSVADFVWTANAFKHEKSIYIIGASDTAAHKCQTASEAAIRLAKEQKLDLRAGHVVDRL